MKVAVFSSKPYDEKYLDKSATDDLELRFFEHKLDRKTAVISKGYEVVCCFVNDDLSEQTIDELADNGVKLIAMRCAGYNNVDLQAAEKRGIKVCRVPEYSPHAVAEHALALLLTLNRNIHRAYNRVRENDYSLNGLLGFDLYQKKVGVIGSGKIGATFCGIMQGLGCDVSVYDPFPNDEVKALGIDYVSLEKIWAESDVISLHCPLLPETRHIINSNSISQMKQGVAIINTSRGALIDTRAVIGALKSGHIGYLGLDVYEEEANLFFEDQSNLLLQDDIFARLLTFPNVLITGHQGFFTNEALNAISNVTLGNIRNFAAGNIDAVHLVKV
ncbi:2-hydroxyacid dehydrogenase [Pseudomaricurvus alcaniphilus]|uniref:2-hydroxyacid dehydrogenase n=1 Tax=Pseudomaricurvus alcaniphilus TaxID=1166482 RepID=UPI0014091489|nr:2-hydroxyacid dehydrogenase [Pseudomaricurvus alcaniphilus]NHN36475.1 2-hydroxyacid dehydrogenase [Pseudomaricurvus alcaniphilus]